MIIKYGISNNNIDVTDICLKKLTDNNIISIPSGDNNRVLYFTDPALYYNKNIYIYTDDKEYIFNEDYLIKIDLINSKLHIIDEAGIKRKINTKLNEIHSKLHIKYGKLQEELPEQQMAIRYIKNKSKILEIGGNIGRNSLVIASIMDNDKDLVVLESDNNIANQLEENKMINNLSFHIEKAALSNRKLIQKGWDTIPSDYLQPGYNWVNTITLKELKNKYNIDFDTLVLDCEGAFYYILMDMPEILNNINTIIMENDYHDITHKEYIDNKLIEHNFYRVYVESGGWGPCYNNFFEVWKR